MLAVLCAPQLAALRPGAEKGFSEKRNNLMLKTAEQLSYLAKIYAPYTFYACRSAPPPPLPPSLPPLAPPLPPPSLPPAPSHLPASAPLPSHFCPLSHPSTSHDAASRPLGGAREGVAGT